MKVKIRIPDYISIGNYQELGNLEHLTQLEKVVKSISIITKTDEDEIRNWHTNDIKNIYGDVNKYVSVKEEFYPIFELDGKQYGYANINDMRLAEMVDLERLCKEPTKNLHEIMAILYRPIKKHKFKDITWNLVHRWKIAKKQSQDIFKSYTLEKYKSKNRYDDGLVMKDLPVSFALGALGFFLATASEYINITMPFSNQKHLEPKEITKMNTNRFRNIGNGLGRFIHSPNQIFSVLQEKNVLLT